MHDIRKLGLQAFTTPDGMTGSAQVQVMAREIDFVTSFGKNLQALLDILGITRMIRKENGSELKTKSEVIGRVSQTFHVWHDNPRQRGTVSGILAEIKAMCRILEHTENYAWQIRDMSQQILPDTTTKQPLLHGVLEVEFQFS